MRTLLSNYQTLIIVLTVAAISCFDEGAYGQAPCSTCGFGNATGTAAVSAGGDATGVESAALGALSTVFGEESIAIGAATVGTSTTDANSSIAIGGKAFSYGDFSMAIGHKAESSSTSTYSYVFGSGTLNSNLLNNESNSIMLGMNSNVSTVFIGNSGGTSGSYGNVGIGNITSPASLLHVRDQVRVGIGSSTNGSIIFNNSSNTNTVTFRSGVTTTTHEYILPTAAGSNGDVLTYTTGGQLTWGSGGTATDDWRLVGNSNADADSKLGTLSNFPLKIYANNAERMRVETDGDVGIGTSTPQSKLHVAGHARLGLASTNEGRLIFNNSGNANQIIIRPYPSVPASYTLRLPEDDGDNNDVLTSNGSGNLNWKSGAELGAWMLEGNDISNPTTDFLGTTNNRDMAFRANNTEWMRIRTGGNVGIGTTAPDGVLHVKALSSLDTRLIIEKDADEAGVLAFHNNGDIDPMPDAFIELSEPEQLLIQNSTASKDIKFSVNGTTTGIFELMTISGNHEGVGINVTSPDAALHVETVDENNASESVAVFGLDGSSSGQYVKLANQSTTNGEFAPVIETATDATDIEGLLIEANVPAASDNISVTTEPVMKFVARRTSGSNLAITARPAFLFQTENSRYMQINANGDVGIGTGTAGPSGRLDVNGDVYIGSVANGNPGSDSQLGITTAGEVVDLGISNINFKEDVANIEFDKEAFLDLRPVDFRWKPFNGGQMDVGLIAQEVDQTFPALAIKGFQRMYLPNGDMVRDSLGIPVVDSTQQEVRGVRYHKLPVYLLSLAKDQQQEIEGLRTQIETLSTIVQNCCSAEPNDRLEDGSNANDGEEGSTEIEEYVLLRNDPNPFFDYTDIKYETSSCENCQIIITDMNGRVVKRIGLRDSNGKIRVYSSEIGTGVFSYSIIEEGRVIGSSKMISSRN